MSNDQPQGLAWVVVTLVAEIPPLVRLSRTNVVRVIHICFSGLNSFEFERCVLLRFPKLRIGAQEKPVCAVMMDVVSSLPMNLKLELIFKLFQP